MKIKEWLASPDSMGVIGVVVVMVALGGFGLIAKVHPEWMPIPHAMDEKEIAREAARGTMFGFGLIGLFLSFFITIPAMMARSLLGRALFGGLVLWTLFTGLSSCIKAVMM